MPGAADHTYPVGSVEARAFDFALELMERLAEVLPSGNLGFTSTIAPQHDDSTHVVVAQAEDLGLELCAEGHGLFRLTAEYTFTASAVSQFMTVRSSSIKLFVERSNAPVFTLDYLRESGSNIPSAHWNVHAKRDDVERALRSTGNRFRGKNYRKRIAAGKPTRLGDVHFPVGGHRFRPCIEDVLEMLVLEFGVDTLPNALQALARGRQRWREMQLAAAVSDHPDVATRELERLGYEIRPPLHVRPERINRTTVL